MKIPKGYSGFTLIELLIVIAVIGVLAAVILVALNPLEQIARGRDSGRKNTLSQLVTALQSYAATNGAYPSWYYMATLTQSGELKALPPLISYSSGIPKCVYNDHSSRGYCYNNTGSPPSDAVIYTVLESRSERAKCASGLSAYFYWSSSLGRSSVVCTSVAEPLPINGSGLTFVN